MALAETEIAIDPRPRAAAESARDTFPKNIKVDSSAPADVWNVEAEATGHCCSCDSAGQP